MAVHQGLGGNLRGGGGNATALSGALLDTPGADDGGNGSGTSPGDPPPTEAPGSGPGRRVSIRPQPTRAPRDERMALGPLRGREPAIWVWGGGQMGLYTTC